MIYPLIIVNGGVAMDKIDYLLKKYRSPYVKGEIHSPQTNLKLKQNQRRIEKHVICNQLIDEINLHFTNVQKDFLHYLIDYFHKDFKKLHARAKKEAIILTFMFYVKKVENARINLNNYSICKKYDLTDSIFKLILCRMCDTFIKNSPIKFQESTKYDHDILSKNGGKI